ncbi:unnamed protein product [Lupinus luteus]|uniref:E3 ubiquitin-protein ligase n=1 Tax=Lupinus luteus TaxID=3873 RepID=A0AAV1Y2M9_LUPLU
MADDMEIDSPSGSQTLKPRDRIVKKLAHFGVPEEQLDQPGLVAFVKDKRELIPELVSVILPTDVEVGEALPDSKSGSKKLPLGVTMKKTFRHSMVWLQWLMFEGDPGAALKGLSEMSVGQRGVCGDVWGHNDIAYRCRTCEHDGTCAICVPCFENGDHKGHDYFVIYTGGGCCDCGDVTAWQRKGFCSKHKGVEQIQPLPEELSNSVAPVLGSLFICWNARLKFASDSAMSAERKKAGNELTFAVVDMLLEFCKHSESLLSFVARSLFSSTGLLNILVRAERFLADVVIRKLNELLLKLLGEPIFKYEFAKVFLAYYPTVVNEAIEECSDQPLKKYPLLSTFSVQILTVPTLTPRLVKEINLLAMQLGCLEKIFNSCSENGRLQISNWANLYETTICVVKDIRFVMSHVVVPKYVTNDQQDISRTWMRLLSFVQGMNPSKRETGQHIEEETENVHLPFVLGDSIANIHSLLVGGAFSDSSKGGMEDEIVWISEKHETDDGDNVRNTKVGRLSQESSACCVTSNNSAFASPKVPEIESDASSPFDLPHSVTWLIYECLRAIEHWLEVENTPGSLPNMFNSDSVYDGNYSAFKRTISNFRKGKYTFGKLASSSEDYGKRCSDFSLDGSEMGKNIVKDGKLKTNGEIDSENTSTYLGFDNNATEEDFPAESDCLRFLSSPDWPHIVYDVSSQDISLHIPLHRLLSMLLQKALVIYFNESKVHDVTDDCSTNSLSTIRVDFFGRALRGTHPHGFSSFIMEHPLRIRVFCAEVHAGMWRKNGDAALLSYEWYRSVRWSEQGLELDLFLLQCCAAFAPEDQYVSRILDRFGLSNYLSLNLERSSEYEPVLAQEMLTLIIQIVKERRFCGLTTAESLKRELIYKLAIGDATHSQLVKSLPRDLSKFEQLQDILDTVAVYSNPSGFNQGMYSLRWPFWKELDLYHPRWNSKDLQVAEERYVRFCGGSALTTQLPRWTNIHPPLKGIARIATCKVVMQIIRAVLFYAVFTFQSAESRAPDDVLLPALHLLSLSLDICFQQKESSENIYHDVAQIPIIAYSVEIIDANAFYGVGEQSLLSLLVVLMEMNRKETADNFVEAGGFSVSSLIESLLKKFAEIDHRCMTKLQKLAPEVVSHISERCPTRDLSVSFSASDSEKRKAKARERQAAIMEKMRAQQTKFLASIDSTVANSSQVGHQEGDFDTDAEESKQVVCSLCHDHSSEHPISFLVLLQKSRLVSSVDKGPPSWDQLCRSDKQHMPTTTKMTDTSVINLTSSSSGSTSSSHLTKLVQIAANELASSGDPGEVNAFLQYVKNQFPSLGNFQLLDTSIDEKEKTPYTFDNLEHGMYFSIREEMRDLAMSSNMMNEDEKVPTTGGDTNTIIDTESVLLGKYTGDLVREMSESSSASEIACTENTYVESTTQHPSYDGFGPTDCDGVHLSSCGHAVHQGCLDRYLSSLKERFVRRIVFEGGHIVDPDQGEFLCPVCRRLVNCVLPNLPGELQKSSKLSIGLAIGSIHTAVPSAESSEVTYSLRLQQALNLLRSAASTVGKDKFLKAIPLRQIDSTRPNLETFSRVLSNIYFPGKQDKLSKFARLNHSMLMWDTLKYSLMSMEIAARCGRTSLTPNFALSAMHEELKSSSGFILSLLLKLVQKTRTKNSLHVLQRFRGIQLFVESICSGVSLHFANDDMSGRGDMLSILKHIEMDLSNIDIRFWKQASDPILAHDPFSTLMWILFCLPYPFLSCEESLLSLVHVFYVVAVTQAIILYCERSQHKPSESGISNCLITDVYKIISESGCDQQYFMSNYFDPNVDIKDAIRRFSFPYLRRCALLWKILHSSIPAPFSDEEIVLDRSWNAPNDIMDRANIELFEVTKIQELEHMFKIPSLDVVLKDEVSRSSVTIWCRHFFKEFESHGIQPTMYVTPAAPFELMRLPNVYQDLLRRCIKQRCPECESILHEPALCLLCGRLCSPSWKSCCRESGCQTHAATCGAGTGVFLLIRRTTIILQRSARQAPWPSPYLDAFGEEDFEMNRGKPLYLNEERYAVLTYMVASHGLDRSSKVLGQTTLGTFFQI